MKSTSYYIKARLFPTIISAIPIFSLYFIGIDQQIVDFLNFLEGYKWVGDITISAAMVYLFVQLNRFASKEIYQRLYFQDEKNMPTTRFLLNKDDTLSTDIKVKLYKHIEDDFQIKLLKAEEEANDENEARKRIVTAISQIRKVTRGNNLLFQHNVEYGFMRNLIGGATIAFIVSVFNIWYFHSYNHNEFGFKLNLVLTFLYLIPIVFSKLIIGRYGNYYAKILLEQYLTK